MEIFAQRLKELRISKQLSQQALGLELKVSQAAIARWEAGKQVPSVVDAVTIARFFGVSLDYLLGETDF